MSGQGDQGRRPGGPPGVHGEKYDLEALMKIVEDERAYDESVKTRVTQDDIRRLIEKKRGKRK